MNEIAENVAVIVDEHIVPIDFVILEMDENIVLSDATMPVGKLRGHPYTYPLIIYPQLPIRVMSIGCGLSNG